MFLCILYVNSTYIFTTLLERGRKKKLIIYDFLFAAKKRERRKNTAFRKPLRKLKRNKNSQINNIIHIALRKQMRKITLLVTTPNINN